MNRIVLIGNGFDLAHGLPTKYTDFMDWYWREFAGNFTRLRVYPYEDNFIRFDWENGDEFYCTFNLNPNHFFRLAQQIETFDEFVQLISEANKLSRLQFNLSFKNQFWQHISEKSCLETWLDIENEYYSILKSYLNAENRNKLIKNLNDEFCQVKDLLEKYLTEVCQEKVTKIDSIKDAINSPINPEHTAISRQKQEKIHRFSDLRYKLLLNFNYTNTADKLFVGFNRVINIHGQLNDKENPIIFGYGDELDEDYRKIEQTNDNDFLENIKSIHYHNTSNYRRLLEFLQDEPYQVFVMGHSCGNSDRTLLNTLFEHENCISIQPFYHRWKDKETGLWKDNYTDLVKNISRNFNDKQNLRDIVVNKKFCTPLVPAKEEG